LVAAIQATALDRVMSMYAADVGLIRRRTATAACRNRSEDKELAFATASFESAAER